MSNTTLHWRLREVLAELHAEDRWAVLTCYILHTNRRGRAWPTLDTIMQEIGSGSRKTIVAAKRWLIKHGCLVRVPYSKRVDAERDMPPRTDVFEVTGSIVIGGVVTPILYGNRDDSSPEELSIVPSGESSPGEPKDITNKDSKDITNKDSSPASGLSIVHSVESPPSVPEGIANKDSEGIKGSAGEKKVRISPWWELVLKNSLGLDLEGVEWAMIPGSVHGLGQKILTGVGAVDGTLDELRAVYEEYETGWAGQEHPRMKSPDKIAARIVERRSKKPAQSGALYPELDTPEESIEDINKRIGLLREKETYEQAASG